MVNHGAIRQWPHSVAKQSQVKLISSCKSIVLEKLAIFMEGLNSAQWNWHQYENDASRTDSTNFMRNKGENTSRHAAAHSALNTALVIVGPNLRFAEASRYSMYHKQLPLEHLVTCRCCELRKLGCIFNWFWSRVPLALTIFIHLGLLRRIISWV